MPWHDSITLFLRLGILGILIDLRHSGSWPEITKSKTFHQVEVIAVTRNLHISRILNTSYVLWLTSWLAPTTLCPADFLLTIHVMTALCGTRAKSQLWKKHVEMYGEAAFSFRVELIIPILKYSIIRKRQYHYVTLWKGIFCWKTKWVL